MRGGAEGATARAQLGGEGQGAGHAAPQQQRGPSFYKVYATWQKGKERVSAEGKGENEVFRKLSERVKFETGRAQQ